MNATARMLTALLLAAGTVAPALAEQPPAMPESLSNEIHAQGEAALRTMRIEIAQDINGKGRALETLGAVLDRAAPIVASSEGAPAAPNAGSDSSSGRLNSLFPAPVSVPSVSLPRIFDGR